MMRTAIRGVAIGLFAACMLAVGDGCGGTSAEPTGDGGGGGSTGLIRGKIVNTAGQAVGGVAVTLIDPTSGNPSNAAAPVTTDATGQFAFLLVPFGTYKVRAGSGTQTVTSAAVTLNVINYNITVGTLQLGESGPPEPPF